MSEAENLKVNDLEVNSVIKNYLISATDLQGLIALAKAVAKIRGMS